MILETPGRKRASKARNVLCTCCLALTTLKLRINWNTKYKSIKSIPKCSKFYALSTLFGRGRPQMAALRLACLGLGRVKKGRIGNKFKGDMKTVKLFVNIQNGIRGNWIPFDYTFIISLKNGSFFGQKSFIFPSRILKLLITSALSCVSQP